jgi:hypothetical protein
MGNTKFIVNRWVKFIYQNDICIGRTFLYDEKGSFEPIHQFVFLINTNRETKKISFSECHELKYLEFVKKPNASTELKIEQEDLTLSSVFGLLICPTIENKTIQTLAKYQCSRIFRN